MKQFWKHAILSCDCFFYRIIIFNTEKRKPCPALYSTLQYCSGESVSYCAARCELAYFHLKAIKVAHADACLLKQSIMFAPGKQSLVIKDLLEDGSHWK